MNLPNKLTLFRIFLIPVFILVMLFNIPSKYLIACVIFIVASITDAMDGHIARKHNLITDFGKFMDPLADKLLVISALICMIEVDLVSSWMVIIIVARELTVSILRAIAVSYTHLDVYKRQDLVSDVGSVLIGKEAVECGLINEVGGLKGGFGVGDREFALFFIKADFFSKM